MNSNVPIKNKEKLDEILVEIREIFTAKDYFEWVRKDGFSNNDNEYYGVVTTGGKIHVKFMKPWIVRRNASHLVNEKNNILMKRIYGKSIYSYAWDRVLQKEEVDFEKSKKEYEELVASMTKFDDYQKMMESKSKACVYVDEHKNVFKFIISGAKNIGKVIKGQELNMYMDCTSTDGQTYGLAISNIDEKFVAFLPESINLFNELWENNFTTKYKAKVVEVNQSEKTISITITVDDLMQAKINNGEIDNINGVSDKEYTLPAEEIKGTLEYIRKEAESNIQKKYNSARNISWWVSSFENGNAIANEKMSYEQLKLHTSKEWGIIDSEESIAYYNEVFTKRSLIDNIDKIDKLNVGDKVKYVLDFDQWGNTYVNIANMKGSVLAESRACIDFLRDLSLFGYIKIEDMEVSYVYDGLETVRAKTPLFSVEYRIKYNPGKIENRKEQLNNLIEQEITRLQNEQDL